MAEDRTPDDSRCRPRAPNAPGVDTSNSNQGNPLQWEQACAAGNYNTYATQLAQKSEGLGVRAKYQRHPPRHRSERWLGSGLCSGVPVRKAPTGRGATVARFPQ